MIEPVLKRVARVVQAGVGDAVDALERFGSGSVIREALREVDRVAEETNGELKSATARRLLAVKQRRAIGERLDTLREDVRFAVRSGRDDLASAVLERQVELEEERSRLDRMEARASDDERRLAEAIDALSERKRAMAATLDAFENAQAEAETTTSPPGSDRERRVRRAEAAMNRTLYGATNDMASFGQALAGDMKAAAKIAELEALRRAAQVKERLAEAARRVADERRWGV